MRSKILDSWWLNLSICRKNFKNIFSSHIFSNPVVQQSQCPVMLISSNLGILLVMHLNSVLPSLVCRNIHRSRDHGLPGYNVFREKCGLPPACSWTWAPQEIPHSTWTYLSDLYYHPSHIDLFTAGLAEIPVTGGSLGTTFACIVGSQFQKLKDGDKFFFSHTGIPNSFTNKQYLAISQRSLADILCDNTDFDETPTDAFKLSSDCNPWRPCSDRIELDVGLFLEAYW